MLVALERLDAAPSDEELDRQRRRLAQDKLEYERAELEFKWEKLRRSRSDWEAQAECAMDLIGLSSASSDPGHVVNHSSPRHSIDGDDDPKLFHDGPIPVTRRVCRYWDGDQRFYPGTVVDSKKSAGKWYHHVVYDDGEDAWESEVDDIDDPNVPRCRRLPTCWKRRGHCGKCTGMTRVVAKMFKSGHAPSTKSESSSSSIRDRHPPKRLRDDNDWAQLPSREWRSSLIEI